MTRFDPEILRAACLMLAVIQVVMLASLYFGVAPHPPQAIPLFALPPFLAVSIGLALCAMQLAERLTGRILAGLAGLCALLSFGPQKYFDAAFPEIWIAVVSAQFAVLLIIVQLVMARKEKPGA